MNNLFDELPDKKALEQLVSGENDPASINYKRELARPKVKWRSVIFNVLGFAALFAAVTTALWFSSGSVLVTVLVPLALGLIYVLFRLSSVLIFCVECYQLLAPEKRRMACRFEPSCSQYMILAIRKYGAIRGLIKGIKRLRRCHYPNGGYDLP